jgi:plastocyanin
MAVPIVGGELRHEQSLAARSSAAHRILAQAVIAPGAGAAAAHTVADKAVKRLVCLYAAGTAGDIRVELNAAAAATDMPLVPGEYFAVEVEVGDTVSFWNTTGGGLNVYVMETR